MSESNRSLADLQRQEYEQQLTVNRLQRMVYVFADSTPATRAALLTAQAQLFETQRQIVILKATPLPTVVASSLQEKSVVTRGIKPASDASKAAGQVDNAPQLVMGKTGVGVAVRLQMEYVPTAIYHLFERTQQPLLECLIASESRQKRLLRISSYIEGYSAQDVCTLEIEQKDEIKPIRQLPALFSERARSVRELTRAMLNVLVEDLESGKVIEHQTKPIWLLARNSAPLGVKNPSTGKWDDLSRYYGAFVTPNQEAVMDFLREAVELHVQHKFVGYEAGELVKPQVEALYNALQSQAKIRYVNSIINFNPDAGARTQRVRLPRESLMGKVANCVDGVLLFASLLEAISLNPAIVIIPGHALLGWETSDGSNRWEYLETTMLGDGKSFAEACDHALGLAVQNEQQQELANQANNGEQLWFRRWSLRDLRTKHGITPME